MEHDDREWLTMSEAAHRLGRPKSTVAGWCLRPEITRELRQKVWHVVLDQNLINISQESKRKPKRDALILPIQSLNDIKHQVCPHCGSSDWRRGGYSHLTSGDKNVRMNCNDCLACWSLHLPADNKKPKKTSNHCAKRVGPYVPDSPERVGADRRRWVKGYVSDGLKLGHILTVFGPSLKKEITEYYQEFVNESRQS